MGTTERIQIAAGGGSMGGYLALPDGPGPHPAVVVYMEIFGVNSHIREVTERVAAEGYVALAVDFFHRTGPGVEFGYDDEGFGKGFALLNELKADEMVTDARAAVDYLRGRDDVRGDRIGAMGFCIGGHMTYLTACETDVAAAASFYGGGIAAPEGKILCLFGGIDTLIPSDQVDAIKASLTAAGIDHETVVYPDADHGFFCDQRGTYNKEAAADAWTRVKALFAEKLRA
jgi:carboxymethylenebutenolidase